MQKIQICPIILSLLVIAAALFYFYAGLAYGNHSDSAFSFIAAREILNGNFLFRGWRFPFTTQYFDLLIYALLVKIFGYNELITKAVPAAFLSLTFFFGSLAFSVQDDGKIDYKKALLIFLFSFGISQHTTYNHIIAICHGASTMFAAISLLALRFYLIYPSTKRYYLFFIVNFIMLFDDSLTTYYYIIPLMAVLILFCFIKKGGSIPVIPLFCSLLYAVISAGIIIWAFRYLGAFNVLRHSPTLFTAGIDGIFYNLRGLVELFPTILGVDSNLPILQYLSAIGVTLLLLFTFIAWIIKNIEKPDILSLTGVVSLFVIIAGLAASQKFTLYDTRYYFPSLFLLKLALGAVFYESIVKKAATKRLYWVFALILFAVNFMILPKFHTELNNKSDMEIISLLKREGLKDGYGTYANSQNISMASGFENEVFQIAFFTYPDKQGIYRNTATSDKSWYYKPANFLIVSENGYPGHNDKEILAFAYTQFGQPKKELSVQGRWILIWDYDISTKLERVYLRFAHMKRGFKDGVWEAVGRGGSRIGFLNDYNKPLKVAFEMDIEGSFDAELYFSGAVDSSVSLKGGEKVHYTNSFILKPGRTDLTFSTSARFKLTQLKYDAEEVE
ncbi:MAG: hypothetical protein LBP51_05520 [Deferribacteraceae bacterium]|jgi:hypothetical protein|nr:hypothetical protein [Deferribacteraceae bacterium]